jgi:endonuclease YncB( thermonuclease family)
MIRPRLARQIAGPILLALVLVAAGSRPTAAADCTMPPKPANLAPATVDRVSDGDTVWLRFPDGQRKRTRLVGIDAPEAHHNFGRQATDFTERLLPPDTPVGVEQDVEKRDRYGRLLAYLWLPDGARSSDASSSTTQITGNGRSGSADSPGRPPLALMVRDEPRDG